MKTIDDNLVGYLLQALDPDEQRDTESHLRDNPEAQRRLAMLRRALEPLSADTDRIEPPADLCVRTLARLAEHQCRSQPVVAPPPGLHEHEPTYSRWRRVDWLVAAALLFIAGGVGVVLMYQLRTPDRIQLCQNNLRQLHTALIDYSYAHDGKFPEVEKERPRDIAGIFVPRLREAGVLPDSVSLHCRPSDVVPPQQRLVIRDVQELEKRYAQERENQKTGQAGTPFKDAARHLAGCYAYNLGYSPDGKTLVGLRRDSEGRLPILADRPPFKEGQDAGAPDANSPNHDGTGQNVLCVDGTARFWPTPNAGIGGDSIYVNREGKIAAGKDITDTVLGASSARPFPDAGD